METERVTGHNETENASKAFAVDFDDDDQVTRAVRRAVAAALREHKEKGQYVVSWQDGKTVIIAPEDIVVPDETD